MRTFVSRISPKMIIPHDNIPHNNILHILFAFAATWSLAYLFTKKQPLSWPQSLYGYYAGYSTGLRSLSLLLIGPLFKRRLGMRDTSIMILSLLTNAAGEAFMGFSHVTWMVFVGE